MRLDAGRAVEQNTASSLGALCPEPVAQILETPRVKAGFHPKVLCLGSRYISGVPVRKSRSCAHPDEQAIPISRIAFMNRALMRFSWRRLTASRRGAQRLESTLPFGELDLSRVSVGLIQEEIANSRKEKGRP